MKKELIDYIIGSGSIASLIGALLFAYLGAFVVLLLRVKKRDVDSDRTPEHFSFKFFWCDTSKKIYATIILIALTVRFSRDLIGADITAYVAVIIGLASEKLADIWRSKDIMGLGKSNTPKP